MGNSIIDEKRQGLLLKTGGGIGTRTNCIGQPGWLIRDCDTFDVISPAKPDVDAHLPKEGATTGNNAGHTISMGKLLSHVKDEYERTNPKSGLKTWLQVHLAFYRDRNCEATIQPRERCFAKIGGLILVSQR